MRKSVKTIKVMLTVDDLRKLTALTTYFKDGLPNENFCQDDVIRYAIDELDKSLKQELFEKGVNDRLASNWSPNPPKNGAA